MRNKVLALVIGCSIALVGCGAQPQPEEPEVQVTSETTEGSSETSETTGAEAEPADEEFFDEEFSYGQELTPDENGRVSNGFMSIQMPEGSEGTYIAYSYNNDINIYDKASNEAGYGGFAFGVAITDSFEEYGGMRTKIGELTDAQGKLYHVLISYPSDVQWDYTQSEQAPDSYKALYDNAREIIATLQPDDGGEYVDGAGTRGEELFGSYVKDIIKQIKEASGADELEAAGLSAVYYAMTQGDEPKDPMKSIGIAYTDVNGNGVEDMVIGDIETQQVYDIFTTVDGKPAHVASGHWRDYYKLDSYSLAEYISEAAGVQVIDIYNLTSNTTELFYQYGLKLDETDSANTRYYVCYDGPDGEWQELSKEDYEIRINNIENFPGDKEVTFKALGEF